MIFTGKSFDGGIAQWLEQFAHNELVPGSSPGTPTIKAPTQVRCFFMFSCKL